MLGTVGFNLDNRDRVATLVAMLSYWGVHNQNPTVDEAASEFAQLLKDRILEQKSGVVPAPVSPVEAAPSAPVAVEQNGPEKVVIQLVPSTSDISELVAEAGFNPRLQLTFKSKRSLSNIVDHVTKKWVTVAGVSVAQGAAIRLSSLGAAGVSGCDWGIESTEISILEVYHMLGCPPAIKLEYYWAGATFSDHDHSQEVEEVDDEQFEHISREEENAKMDSIFEPTQYVHPLSQTYTIFETPTVFEMDPVAQQLGAMNLVADPFDEANSLSVDADAHFEPMTADDDDELLLFDDQVSADSLLADDAGSLEEPAPCPKPVSGPRIIFSAQPKKSAPVPVTLAVSQAQPATPFAFPATPSALNVSYGMTSADPFLFSMDSDPVFGLTVIMGSSAAVNAPRYGLDPMNSPSDEPLFLSAVPASPVPARSKLTKQHERPLATLDGSDADDEEYAYAFNHFTTPKRPRMDAAPLL